MAKDVKFDIAAENSTKTAFNAIKADLKSVTAGIGSMKTAFLGIGAATAGLYAIGRALGAVTDAAMVQRDAETKVAAVIKATGGAAGYSLKELQKMASGFQELTTFGDEAILTGQSILLTFKNIGGDIFKRTTAAALDMSTVMKTDLKSSMVLLGKAINDPVAGLSALTRVGVTFTEQQKEEIKAMMEVNNIAGAQALVLKELESEFGGAAEAAGGPFQKAMAQLSNVWGDLLEEIGFAITDNEAFVIGLQVLKDYLVELIPLVGEAVQRFLAWIGPVETLRARIDAFTDRAKSLLDVLKTINKYSQFVGVGAMVDYSKQALSAGASLLTTGSFATGTGPQGLPRDGIFYGHRGEIVLNPTESAARSGPTINITMAPTFMSGDPGAARAVAAEIKTALKDLNHRWNG
jgi:hypothetical protein